MMKKWFVLLPFILPLYVARFQIGPLPTTLLEIAILALTAGWLAERKTAGLRDAWKQLGRWQLPLIAWTIVGAIAVGVSPVTLQALGLFRAYFIEPLLMFVIGMDLLRTKEDREQLWRNTSIVTMVLTAWAILQVLTGWSIPHPWNAAPGRRATGPFPFPNALALFVTPIAALAFVRVIRMLDAMKAGWRASMDALRSVWLDGLTAITGVITILCAQSDGGLVAFAAAAFVAMMLHKHSRRFAIELMILGLIIIAIAPPLRAHILEIATFKDWSGMVRVVMWKETINMLKDHLALGAGLGAYPTVIAAYHRATWMEIFQYPHNILLNLWSEVGPLGVVAFGGILVTWLHAGIRRAKNEISQTVVIVTVIVALLVHGLVDVPYFKNDLAVLFWILILLTLPSYDSERTTTR